MNKLKKEQEKQKKTKSLRGFKEKIRKKINHLRRKHQQGKKRGRKISLKMPTVRYFLHI